MKPHPTDTQYPWPHEQSAFVVMKYGDGWGIYNRSMDRMILDEQDQPLQLPAAESCESLIRMLFTPIKKTKRM